MEFAFTTGGLVVQVDSVAGADRKTVNNRLAHASMELVPAPASEFISKREKLFDILREEPEREYVCIGDTEIWVYKKLA